MRKVIVITIAIILWLIAVTPLVVMLVQNVDEVKTVDLGIIKVEQIILGTNDWLKPDFNYLTSSFMGKSYELVMVEVTTRGQIIYLGKTAENEWYRAEENLDIGFLQEVKETKIDGKDKDLVVYYSKDFGTVATVSIVSILVFGLIGLAVFFQAFNRAKK